MNSVRKINATTQNNPTFADVASKNGSLLYDIKSLNNIARSTAPKTMLPQFDIIFDELFVGTKASTFDPLRFN